MTFDQIRAVCALARKIGFEESWDEEIFTGRCTIHLKKGEHSFTRHDADRASYLTGLVWVEHCLDATQRPNTTAADNAAFAAAIMEYQNSQG